MSTYRIVVKYWDRHYGDGHTQFRQNFEARRSAKADKEAIDILENALKTHPKPQGRVAEAWAERSDRGYPTTLRKYDGTSGTWVRVDPIRPATSEARRAPGELTDNEKKVLLAIAQSEYQNGTDDKDLVGHHVWSEFIADNAGINKRSVAGVFSSLSKKGLIETYNSYGQNEDTVALTAAGVQALNAIRPAPQENAMQERRIGFRAEEHHVTSSALAKKYPNGWTMAKHLMDWSYRRKGAVEKISAATIRKQGYSVDQVRAALMDNDTFENFDGVVYSGSDGSGGMWRVEITNDATKTHETRVVRDFDTLEHLVAHAARELGATHVSGDGPTTKIFFPRGGEYPYEAASVRRKGGYWHADGPGAREGVKKLPAVVRRLSGAPSRRAAEAPRGSPKPNQENRSRLASYIAHVVMYDVSTSPRDLEVAYHLTPEEARAVLSQQGAWFGPGGKGYAAFVKHIEKALKNKEWFSAPDSKAIPGAARGYGRYVWLLENSAPKNTDQGRKDASDIEDLQRELSNVGFNGWGLAIDNWPEASTYYNAAPSVYRKHARNSETRVEAPRRGGAETAGKQYAEQQIKSEHFDNWVRDQLAEAASMPEDQVVPLETPDDARKIARAMFQELEHDAKRQAPRDNIIPEGQDEAFWRGFHKYCMDSVPWLADELLTLKREIRGATEARA